MALERFLNCLKTPASVVIDAGTTATFQASWHALGVASSISPSKISISQTTNSCAVSPSHPLTLAHVIPFDSHSPVEERQFTLRAVLVGCALGAIIAVKTGFTFGAGLFGSIFGFAILKPLSTSAPSYLGGGYFGPKENNVAQAADSLGLLFTSGFPAAYQLGLLNATPQEDIGRFFVFTFSNSKLVFPSSVASAYTIRSLHVGKGAALDAKRKTKALILSFCFAITLRVVSEYALWDWHLLYMLSRIGWTSAINAESWGWIWEWTPASIGAGMLTGINTYSFLGGSFLAWAIIGPIIVSMGKVRSLSGFHRRSLTHAWAFGIPANPNAPGYMNYASISLTDPVNHPSPRYWLVYIQPSSNMPMTRKRVRQFNRHLTIDSPTTSDPWIPLSVYVGRSQRSYSTILGRITSWSKVQLTQKKILDDLKALSTLLALESKSIPHWLSSDRAPLGITDDSLVKEYFPVSVVVPAILDIYQNLLGVKFVYCYLDLFPREGKYSYGGKPGETNA
ncbi:hypothetical protein EV363DRAFT_1532454 [Boletus edulis]|nr:hypothetical protein EV363DRAFT_1532454 [Boletus edulis]